MLDCMMLNPALWSLLFTYMTLAVLFACLIVTVLPTKLLTSRLLSSMPTLDIKIIFAPIFILKTLAKLPFSPIFLPLIVSLCLS